MNMYPHGRSGRTVQEIWEDFSMSFTPAVREVVEFAKHIPGFRDLSQHDQVTLLKAGTFEVLMVRFASLFNVKDQTAVGERQEPTPSPPNSPNGGLNSCSF